MEGILLERIETNKTISALLLVNETIGLTIIGLKEEVTLLKSKFENIPEYVHMKNNNSYMLNDVLKWNM